MPAAIVVTFDPLLRLGELTVRWQTIGVTLALLVALAVAALMAPDIGGQRPLFRRDRSDPRPRFPAAPQLSSTGEVVVTQPLRLDDMMLILAAIVPGAVIGGRLVHALSFWDAYAAAPLRVFDPAVGSLSLLGAVLGGLLTGSYVARLINAPLLRWMDAAAVPLLVAIGLGKLAQVLGGSGQGVPFDGPWSLALGGPGPWVSSNPGLPSHPSQVYEGLWVLLGIPIVLILTGPRRQLSRVHRFVAWADRQAQEGALFVAAISWFLIGRVVVGFTWRDASVAGPLNSEQLLALVALIVTQLAYRPSVLRSTLAAGRSVRRS